MTTVNMDTAVQSYLAIRTAIKKEEEAFKEKLAPAKDLLAQYEAMIMQELATANASSIKTAHGTAIRTTRKSATVADGSVFRAFVQNEDAWDLVDIRANAPAVAAYIEAHETTPPGVNYSTALTLSVRK